ncbi:MAG: cupin domain-containing protein [Saccharofermentans sp.]|nr:cupin domain-containing protein [Saccharofermentans sp.]
MNRSEELKQKYNLEIHPEGGWFSEVYTSPSGFEGRAFMGSIYFLLEGKDISHFHQIDCDEIWFYHEGCSMRITMILNGKVSEAVLGTGEGQAAMVVIPEGAVFAAENLDKESYCFMSCATTPKFTYDGFRLLGREEVKALCPSEFEQLEYLVIEK